MLPRRNTRLNLRRLGLLSCLCLASNPDGSLRLQYLERRKIEVLLTNSKNFGEKLVLIVMIVDNRI